MSDDKTSQDNIQKNVTEGELAGGDTSDDQASQPTELDSLKESLKETQEQLTRYKEEESGHKEGVRKLQEEIAGLKTQISQKSEEKEILSGLSQEDREYREYLKKLGVYTKTEVEKMVQEKIAPFMEREKVRGKSEQDKVLKEFIKDRPDLQESKDPGGVKMRKVIGMLKRIAPADPFDPNASLMEDLGLAYKWAFGEETNQEALRKAQAEGRAEGTEASETQVGEGASTSSASSGKQRTQEQENLLRDWGVDDETINKK